MRQFTVEVEECKISAHLVPVLVHEYAPYEMNYSFIKAIKMKINSNSRNNAAIFTILV